MTDEMKRHAAHSNVDIDPASERYKLMERDMVERAERILEGDRGVEAIMAEVHARRARRCSETRLEDQP